MVTCKNSIIPINIGTVSAACNIFGCVGKNEITFFYKATLICGQIRLIHISDKFFIKADTRVLLGMNLPIANYRYAGFFKVCLRDGEPFAKSERLSYALNLPMLWIINVPPNIIIVGNGTLAHTLYDRFINSPLLHLIEQCNLVSII